MLHGASSDQTLRVWEVESGRELRTLHGHSGSVYGVALRGDGRLVVSTSWDQTLKVWEVQSGELLVTFTCDGPTQCCALANGRKLILAGDIGGCVHFLRLEEPKRRN